MSNYLKTTVIIPALFLILLTACASTGKHVMDTSAVNTTLSPAEAVQMELGDDQKIVQWGGQIIEITNQKETTELQVLSYPLNRQGKPVRNSKPTGRFSLIYQGYLEAYDYAAGKMITAIGPITDKVVERVGSADKVLPVMHTQDLRLWNDRDFRRGILPHIGIGVGIGL